MGLCDSLARLEDIELRVLTTDTACSKTADRIEPAGFPVMFPAGYAVYYSRKTFGTALSIEMFRHLFAMGRAIAAIPGARALLCEPCAYLAKSLAKPKLAAVPAFMDSLEGAYFLRCSLFFLARERPALMGADMAREGLARLGGSPPGMTQADARDGASAIGLLESTHYLRNQLLRDSDWASMGHSLELRTPLVDAKLLDTLGPYVSGFAGGAGKAMLARSPGEPLPESIINRPKTGLSLPMAQWLVEATDQRVWGGLPMLAAPGTPWARRWARRWARIVVDRVTECE